MTFIPYQQPTFRSPQLPITNWHDDQYNENLFHGVIDWCTWSMLDIGGYQNVSVTGVSGMYGGNMANLRPVQDPNYVDGQVWEAIRSDWIWETGVPYSGPAPTVASGVYVNHTFVPVTVANTNPYSHYINFPLGRIVFNNAISLNSIVQADYSYRSVSFVEAKNDWFTQLLYGSFNAGRADFMSPTGAYSHLAQARRQMPAVGVELVNRRGSQPYELGSLAQQVNQDLLLYVLAENDVDRNQIVDILVSQLDKDIWLIDRKAMKNAPGYPFTLDYRGSPVGSPNQMNYPQLIQAFPSPSRSRIEHCTAQNMDTINGWLYRGVVRITFAAII
jgi:hypothetical protein